MFFLACSNTSLPEADVHGFPLNEGETRVNDAPHSAPRSDEVDSMEVDPEDFRAEDAVPMEID